MVAPNLPTGRADRRFIMVLIACACWLHSPALGRERTSDRTIGGKVVDSVGKPVPNADIYCSAYVYNRFPTVMVRSGPDGAFCIKIPPADKSAIANDRLWAFAPGYSATVRGVPESMREMASVRLTLPPAGKFRLTVRLPDGKPARKALVQVKELAIPTNRCYPIVYGEFFSVPEPLVRRTEVATNDNGVAVLSAWRYQDVDSVVVAAVVPFPIILSCLRA